MKINAEKSSYASLWYQWGLAHFTFFFIEQISAPYCVHNVISSLRLKESCWSNNTGCVTVIGEKFYYFACFNDISEVLFINIIPSLLMSIHSSPNKKKSFKDKVHEWKIWNFTSFYQCKETIYPLVKTISVCWSRQNK